MAAMKLFVVEDSPVIQERLVAMLNDLDDVKVLGIADTEAEAIAGILQHAPDAVVLDIKLRIGTGIGVLREIRQRGSTPAAIMLTNYASPAFRNQCLASGADYFFDKTSEFERIKEALDELGQREPMTS